MSELKRVQDQLRAAISPPSPNPTWLVRDLLAKCKDQAPEATRIAFIENGKIQGSAGRDLDQAYASFRGVMEGYSLL